MYTIFFRQILFWITKKEKYVIKEIVQYNYFKINFCSGLQGLIGICVLNTFFLILILKNVFIF